MREFDERHLYNLLLVKHLGCGGTNYRETDRALGLPLGSTHKILAMHRPITERIANALGYCNKLQGAIRTSAQHRPLKFVVLRGDAASSPSKEK